jgi:hypothetical protein
MWLEAKIGFSIIAMIFIAIVISQFLFVVDMLFSMLLFMSIGLIFIGDILIGSKIKHSDADKLMDSPPRGKEFAALLTINGLLRLIWVDKRPHGKREFVFNGVEASFFNTGESQIHTLNGNMGCLVHEDHDTNIVLNEAKVADEICRDFQSSDVKDVYYKAKKLEAINKEVDLIGR